MDSFIRRYVLAFITLPLSVLLLAGCVPSPSGASIQIQGPANDTVQWQAQQNQYPQACTCPPGPCKTIGNQPLPSSPVQPNGLVYGPTINGVVDQSSIMASSISGPTPCMTVGTVSVVACPPNPGGNPTPVVCEPTNTAAAQGHFTVTGSEDTTSYQKCVRQVEGGDCLEWETITVNNTGVVSLILNGQTVSVSYGAGSTAFSLGFALSQAIDQNSTLAADLMSAPNGPVVYVNAINTGTQYDYPWTTSCTYNETYFSACSFSIALSPTGALASPPPIY